MEVRVFTNSFKNLYNSIVKPVETGSVLENAKRGLGGWRSVGETLLSPVALVVNGAAKGVRVVKRHPVASAILVGIPTAIGMANAYKGHPENAHAKEKMGEIEGTQAQIDQVQGALTQMEAMQPQMQQPVAQAPEAQVSEVQSLVPPPVVNVPQTLQMANSQVAANSAEYDGRINEPQRALA